MSNAALVDIVRPVEYSHLKAAAVTAMKSAEDNLSNHQAIFRKSGHLEMAEKSLGSGWSRDVKWPSMLLVTRWRSPHRGQRKESCAVTQSSPRPLFSSENFLREIYISVSSARQLLGGFLLVLSFSSCPPWRSLSADARHIHSYRSWPLRHTEPLSDDTPAPLRFLPPRVSLAMIKRRSGTRPRCPTQIRLQTLQRRPSSTSRHHLWSLPTFDLPQ